MMISVFLDTAFTTNTLRAFRNGLPEDMQIVRAYQVQSVFPHHAPGHRHVLAVSRFADDNTLFVAFCTQYFLHRGPESERMLVPLELLLLDDPSTHPEYNRYISLRLYVEGVPRERSFIFNDEWGMAALRSFLREDVKLFSSAS